jgi:SAM-dependent methyltransferase
MSISLLDRLLLVGRGFAQADPRLRRILELKIMIQSEQIRKEKMMTRCAVCGCEKLKKIPLIHEISRYNHTAYPLFKCSDCGFTRPWPLPYTETTKDTIYAQAENVRFFDPVKKEIITGTKEFEYFYQYFDFYLDLAKKFRMSGKLLDVGCGVGHLLDVFKKAGFEVEGLEVYEDLVAALKRRGHQAMCAGIESSRIPNEHYDVVVLNQVLEHIEDFEDFVRHLHRVCKPGGHLMLAVPYMFGLMPNLLRSYWYGLGYGQHLNFFSKESLKMLLERNGFEVVEMDITIVDYAHPKFPEIFNMMIRLGMKVVMGMGLGDNLYAVARRKK